MRALLLCIGTLTLASCTGETGGVFFGDQSTAPRLDTGQSNDPFAPCTERTRCCGPANTVCWGDPDKGTVCKCTGLWDCSQNPKKCQQPLPLPPGGASWSCTWTETAFVCKGTTEPQGGGGWTCSYDATQKLWICQHTPPNPTNTPAGAGTWQCAVQSEMGLLVCERDVPKPQPDLGPPPPQVETNCVDAIDNDGDGKVDCLDPDCPPCQPPPCPVGTECCDGKDNDGDGKIDEGNVCGTIGANEPCPPGAYQACDCYCGVHRKCRADGTWGPCLVDNSCKPALITTQSQCGASQYCDYGQCTFGYKGNQCVHHNDCPIGKICDLGQCIVDMYQPWKCP